MKTLLFATALSSLFTLPALQAQDDPPPAPPAAAAETSRAAPPPARLGVALTEREGQAHIQQVLPDSPAAKAGLQEGDVVLAVAGKSVEGIASRIVDLIKSRKPGDSIELLIRRGDKEETRTVTLEEVPPAEREFRGEFRRKKDDSAGKTPDTDDVVRERIERAKDDLTEQFRQSIEKDRKMLEKLENIPFWRDDREEKRFDFKSPPDRPELRLFERPPGPGAPEQRLKLLRHPAGKRLEEAIWKRVEQSVGRALKRSGLDPDVIGKAMDAVKEAREYSLEQEGRRALLKLEAERIETEMQALKEKARKVREELNRAGE